MIYSYEELESRTMKELKAIKEGKQKELYAVRKDKDILISNILSLQGMIEAEKEPTDEG